MASGLEILILGILVNLQEELEGWLGIEMLGTASLASCQSDPIWRKKNNPDNYKHLNLNQCVDQLDGTGFIVSIFFDTSLKSSRTVSQHSNDGAASHIFLTENYSQSSVQPPVSRLIFQRDSFKVF